MRAQLVAEIARRGVMTRPEALRLVPKYVLEDALTDGAITRIFPQVYVLPDRADDRKIRRRGAAVHRPRTALSAIDGLDVWGVFPFRFQSANPFI